MNNKDYVTLTVHIPRWRGVIFRISLGGLVGAFACYVISADRATRYAKAMADWYVKGAKAS